MSIRKVLGADLQNLLILLNKDFIWLVVIANLIAAPIAFVIIYKWLQNYDYRVSITPMPFVLAFFISVLIALVTVSLQTFKVAKSNPVDALKYE
ncbi:MAG: FtsX-like permease family protein [Pedobacter sp.]|nr:MAG: FtsX-like permease family protein [Pedobacter sp.]